MVDIVYLGQPTLCRQTNRSVQAIHGYRAAKPEMLNVICLQAYQRAVSGRYEEALSMLNEHNPAAHRTLRMNNIYIGFATMIKLRKALQQ